MSAHQGLRSMERKVRSAILAELRRSLKELWTEHGDRITLAVMMGGRPQLQITVEPPEEYLEQIEAEVVDQVVSGMTPDERLELAAALGRQRRDA